MHITKYTLVLSLMACAPQRTPKPHILEPVEPKPIDSVCSVDSCSDPRPPGR